MMLIYFLSAGCLLAVGSPRTGNTRWTALETKPTFRAVTWEVCCRPTARVVRASLWWWAVCQAEPSLQPPYLATGKLLDMRWVSDLFIWTVLVLTLYVCTNWFLVTSALSVWLSNIWLVQIWAIGLYNLSLLRASETRNLDERDHLTWDILPFSVLYSFLKMSQLSPKPSLFTKSAKPALQEPRCIIYMYFRMHIYFHSIHEGSVLNPAISDEPLWLRRH